MTLIKEYRDELIALHTKMLKAQQFAEKLPVFREIILKRKLTGEEPYSCFGNKYKDMYFSWGINRGLYDSNFNSSRKIFNYRGEYHNLWLFSIYVNTFNLYDSHEKFGLEHAIDKDLVFYYDYPNSTFYVEDRHIEAFLEQLYIWYKHAIIENDKLRKQQQIDKLKNKLKQLEKEVE